MKQVWIQSMLRAKGWIVPNYGVSIRCPIVLTIQCADTVHFDTQGPKGAEDVEILRVVVRETLSEDLMERLIIDILGVAEELMGTLVLYLLLPVPPPPAFPPLSLYLRPLLLYLLRSLF